MSFFGFFLILSCKKESTRTGFLKIAGFNPIAAVSGDPIQIYGSGFSVDPEKNTVLISGVPAEVVKSSNNRMTVIVPLLAKSAKISLTVEGNSVTSEAKLQVSRLLTGKINGSQILTADQTYLLRGNVSFPTGKLTIKPGTVIYGEKESKASLRLSSVDIEGSPEAPIIFTSNQSSDQRKPGDWQGILFGYGNAGNIYGDNIYAPVFFSGIVRYMRVEYAGFDPGTPLGLAGRPTVNSRFYSVSFYRMFGDRYVSEVVDHLQVSYSASSAFNLIGLTSAKYLIAFGCADNDFTVSNFFVFGFPNIPLGSTTLQYGLSLKNRMNYRASQASSFTLPDNNTTISNFTLIDVDKSRELFSSNYLGESVAFDVLKSSAKNALNSGLPDINLLNNIIINYTNGFALGPSAWDEFELGVDAGTVKQLIIRNNVLLSYGSARIPFNGGAFGRINYDGPRAGFDDVSNQGKTAVFNSNNYTTYQPAELGLDRMLSSLNSSIPDFVPAKALSNLLTDGAQFSGFAFDNPYLNKQVRFIGAFGADDWVRPWAKFDLQNANY